MTRCTHTSGEHDMQLGPAAYSDGQIGAIRQCSRCKYIEPSVEVVTDPIPYTQFDDDDDTEEVLA